MRFWMFMLTICVSLFTSGAHALNSDRSQPATIEADEVEFDFRTGQRVYKGNVIVIQGTLKITGDKMEIQYTNEEMIETATSWGDPATFKQRPDGKQEDVYGEGQTIILNDIEQTLVLIDNAELTQAGNTAKGKEIVYHMDTDKMTVKGLRQEQKKKQEGDDTTTQGAGTGRARVIIRPEPKPGGGTDSKKESNKAEDSNDDKDGAAGSSDGVDPKNEDTADTDKTSE